jgi:CRISPR-associated protein Csb2
VYRLTGPTGMELETTLKVAEALRAAAMSRAQEVLGSVPPLLSGHEPDRSPLAKTHAAFLPLPFVSPTQPHADGHLLGVALPADTPIEERRRVGPVLVAIDHLAVRGVGRLGLDRVRPGDQAPLALRPETWTAPSRVWSSVTPVVLDRFPEPDGRDVGAIAAGAFRRAGLPAPEQVAASRFSPLHGVPPSNRFPTHRPGHGPRRPFTHLTVRFPGPVAGPVLVGAGRYFGLGLFRPLPDCAS